MASYETRYLETAMQCARLTSTQRSNMFAHLEARCECARRICVECNQPATGIHEVVHHVDCPERLSHNPRHKIGIPAEHPPSAAPMRFNTPSMTERIEAHRRQSREYARSEPANYLSGYPNILLDEDQRVAVMTRADVWRLFEYSASVPTGVYVDKCWLFARPERGDRFDEGKRLWLRVYRETDPPTADMPIVSYEILLV